jgi:hypothetical protein
MRWKGNLYKRQSRQQRGWRVRLQSLGGTVRDSDRQARTILSGGQFPNRDTLYPRWFYPGTGDPSVATTVDFSGKPETRTYDFTLPDQQSEWQNVAVSFTTALFRTFY